MKSEKGTPGTLRAWERPTVTKLAIGRETKSVGQTAHSAASDTSGKLTTAEPRPPAAPQSKLGFSIEWAFPLSARWEE